MQFTAVSLPGSYSRAVGRYVPKSIASEKCLTAAEALAMLLDDARRINARPRRIRLTTLDDQDLTCRVQVVTVREAREMIGNRKLAIITRPPQPA